MEVQVEVEVKVNVVSKEEHGERNASKPDGKENGCTEFEDPLRLAWTQPLRGALCLAWLGPLLASLVPLFLSLSLSCRS